MSKFDAGWKVTMFTVLFVPLFVALGFWQLDRANEKRAILSELEQRQAQPPQLFSSNKDYQSFTPITVRGRYDGRHFLIDNQVVSGASGFDVLSVFIEQSGATLLINRGFIAASVERADIPSFETPMSLLTISGAVSRNLGEPFLLREQHAEDKPLTAISPAVIQAFEPDLLRTYLPEWTEDDWFLRIDMGQPSAFETHYQPVRVMPAKHTAYAVQWFAMALALITVYLLLGFGLLKSGKATKVSTN